MDLFTAAASQIMASATLGGFGLLASLIVMERRPLPVPPHSPQSAFVAWPAADRGTGWRDCNVKEARLKTGGTSAYHRR